MKAIENNWAADVFEEFPTVKWFLDLCEKFHQQHLETTKDVGGKVKGTGVLAAGEDSTVEGKVVKALFIDSGAETVDQLPKWMKTSQSDRLIAKMCMGGK